MMITTIALVQLFVIVGTITVLVAIGIIRIFGIATISKGCNLHFF